jgi:2-oxo-3-(phosphooxy)propyl 3-oxoalkanoate synthase
MIIDTENRVAALPMRFEQTVNRELVHKWSLAEVFLTDNARIGESRYICAAQLPASHGYFNDHVDAAGVVDPLLILETARQVATCGAHLHCGVPRSAVLVLEAYSVDLAGPVSADRGARPPELVAVTSVAERETRARRPGSLSFVSELSLSGTAIGTVSMEVTWLDADQYRALRRMRRGGEPPTAFECAGPANGAPVDPKLVHRFNPANVVICGLDASAPEVSAFLDTGCYRNRAMFDHPYDHVPAMVLTEAARQLTVIAAGTSTARIRAVLGRFTAFAELDRPVRLSTTPSGGGSAEVSLTQAGRAVAEIDIVTD